MSTDLPAPYPDRGDWAWVTCDRDGHVALFITGGEGPVPVATLHPDYPLDAELRIDDLPVMSDVREVTAWPDTDAAERGFFVYFWRDATAGPKIDSYELVAAPYRPRTLDTLPDDLAEAARSVRFTALSFTESWRVDVRAHMTCVEFQH
jgi:hypothetical protein